MIDREKVITQVKQGKYPPHWHVYYGNSNYSYLILCWLFTWVVSLIIAFFVGAFFGFAGICFKVTLIVRHQNRGC